MERTMRLGRVAVLDRGEGARRVLRAVRELAVSYTHLTLPTTPYV